MAPITRSPVAVSCGRPSGLPGRDNGRLVVSLRGEHDLSTVHVVSETLARAIAVDDNDVVVDLSEVQFMDAATVGVLCRAWELLRLRARSLVLRSPSPNAWRVLELCINTAKRDASHSIYARTAAVAGRGAP